MAYLKEIYQRRCYRCRKPATVTLHNWRNAELSDYCGQHGKPALAEMQKIELREHESQKTGKASAR